jgi:hypothetical protein
MARAPHKPWFLNRLQAQQLSPDFWIGCSAERIVSPAPLSLSGTCRILAPILAKLSQTVKLSHQKIVASGRHQGLSIQESTSAIPGRAVEAETPRIRQEPEKSKTIHCRSSRFHFWF